MTESIVSQMFQTDHRWCDSRRQLLDRFAYGVIEVFQPFPIQAAVEGGTDVRTDHPKFYVILLVDHRVLYVFYYQPTVNRHGRRRKKHTLIIVRITLTVPNTTLAGVMLETSLARFKVSMATFSEERATSRRFCR